MRVSKRVRKAAVELCATGASECSEKEDIFFIGHLFKVDSEEADQVSLLAALAFREAQGQQDPPPGQPVWLSWAEAYAEAEAMLREGWSPS